MKATILAAVLALLGLTAAAQRTAVPAENSKTISFDSYFNTLNIAGGVEVVLTDGASDKIIVEGVADQLWATVAGEELSLGRSYGRSPLKIYVPATQVSKIYLNGEASLASADVLSSKQLRIVLAGEGKINVKSNGRVMVEPVDDIHFIKGK